MIINHSHHNILTHCLHCQIITHLGLAYQKLVWKKKRTDQNAAATVKEMKIYIVSS